MTLNKFIFFLYKNNIVVYKCSRIYYYTHTNIYNYIMCVCVRVRKTLQSLWCIQYNFFYLKSNTYIYHNVTLLNNYLNYTTLYKLQYFLLFSTLLPEFFLHEGSRKDDVAANWYHVNAESSK